VKFNYRYRQNLNVFYSFFVIFLSFCLVTDTGRVYIYLYCFFKALICSYEGNLVEVEFVNNNKTDADEQQQQK